jgi:hypothetical protein
LPDFCGPDENFLDIINLSYDEEILKYLMKNLTQNVHLKIRDYNPLLEKYLNQ